MRFRTCGRWLAFVWLFALALAATGADARSRSKIRAADGALVVNGRTVVRLRRSNGGSSPEDRAVTAAERLRRLEDDGLSVASIQAQRRGSRWRVKAGGSPLLFATRADARAAGSTSAGLARSWAAEIRAALLLPAVQLRPSRIVIPFGEERSIAVGGWADGPLAARSVSGGHEVAVRVERRRVSIRGTKVGSGRVLVRIGEDVAYGEFDVRKWAGALPHGLTVEVTGRPVAPVVLVRPVVESALLRSVPHEPGCRVHIIGAPVIRGGFALGTTKTVSARVTISGPGYLTFSGRAQAQVINRDLGPLEAARLFYSNEPEHIDRYGTLFAAPVTGVTPIRLMFHHDNRMSRSIALTVTLANPTDHDVAIHVIAGFVPTGRRPQAVGYRAGRVFWRNWIRRSGEMARIPAHSILPILTQRVESKTTTSGVAEIRMVDAQPHSELLLTVAAVPPGDTGFPTSVLDRVDPWRWAAPRPLSETETTALRSRERSSPPIYPASRYVDAEYKCGQSWAFVPLGRVEGAGIKTAGADWTGNLGNYGVLYNIRLKLENPLPTTQKVEIVFGPGGGPAMAVFCVAGKYCEVPELGPGDQRAVARFTLRPHETRTVPIQTLPLGGSFYPANLIVK